MKHLKKITISNARRFGKDVEIDLCPGANIFLAPNGTGKTTIFEAIEFALTGSIQRLSNPPLSLIRDKQDGMTVRLDFDDGHFCQVSYKKNEEPQISGNHKALFPNHTPQEIPFLLRITHLLEQRGHNWFIQECDKAQAGSLLDKLSIGKELSAIAKTKTPTLGAATRTLTERNDKRNHHLARLASFEEKLKARTASKLDYTLKPLADIWSELKDTHSLTSTIEAVEPSDLNIDSVVSYKGLVQNVVTQIKENTNKALLSLSSLESKIPLFQSNKSEILKQKSEISINQLLIPDLNKDLNNLKGGQLEFQKNMVIVREQNESLQKIKKLSNKKIEEDAKFKTIAQQIVNASGLLGEQKKKFQQQTEAIDKSNEALRKYNLLRQRESDAAQYTRQLLALQGTLEAWKSQNDRIIKVTQTIARLTGERAQAQKAVDDLLAQEFIFADQHKESQNRLSSLRSAADAIISAVGIISSNLPEDQGECPVCNAAYSAEELRAKINLALQKIDPILKKEVDDNQILINNLEAVRKNILDAKNSLSQIISSFSENEGILKEALASITENCIPKFQGQNTIAEAEAWLTEEKATNDGALQAAAIDKANFGPEPSSEDISLLVSIRDEINREIQSIENNIGTLNSSSKISETEIANIEKELSTADANDLDGQISAVETSLQQIAEQISQTERDLVEKEEKKTEVEKNISNLKISIARLEGHANEILTEWLSAGLLDEPSNEQFLRVRTDLNATNERLDKSLQTLEKLGEELGRWNVAEKFQLLDKEIKKEAGEPGEEAYLESLKQQDLKFTSEISHIKERKKALDKLYAKINKELGAFHEQIKSINPFWTSLLKKIVVNPRFISTELESYSERNKPQAEVLVGLHDHTVSVMDVASEAQATDLQLTFMLSMASRYKWSPWKSLLLDDPTQHHDLVHASGVFDLLRDYIIDQDFQIIMGTHDIVQGKFFQRKLQNENIDVKLWRLIADDNGVRAEEVN